MSPSLARPLTGLFAALLLAPVALDGQTRMERGPVGRVPIGPAPQNIGFDGSGTYGVIAKVIWSPAPNAPSPVSSYIVKRRLLEDPACCNLTSPPLQTTTFTDPGLLRKGHYMFTIQVNYADGSVGSGEFGIGVDGVRNPVVTAQDKGPGLVRLSWNNQIPGTGGFMIRGPGFDGDKVVSGASLDTPLLPPGTHTWRMASIYTQGLGVLSPASEWSTVTHTVSYGSGRYRISLEGFKAISTTAEDPIRVDGRGDEVFITTQVSEYGYHKMVSTRMTRTPTFGDVWNFPGRIKAGSLSQTGGIQANDEYPPITQYISQLQPATLYNLPYLLWEGELNEISGAVIISPAIWESEGDDRLFPYFAAFQAAAASNLPYRPQLLNYVPPGLTKEGVLDMWNPVRSCPTPPTPNHAATLFVPPINGWGDEPIDMNQNRQYCPVYVAINWRLAKSLTTVNPASVSEISFTGPTGWQYKLFIRIEKWPR